MCVVYVSCFFHSVAQCHDFALIWITTFHCIMYICTLGFCELSVCSLYGSDDQGWIGHWLHHSLPCSSVLLAADIIETIANKMRKQEINTGWRDEVTS